MDSATLIEIAGVACGDGDLAHRLRPSILAALRVSARPAGLPAAVPPSSPRSLRV
jgi:hypothetical protein